MGWLVPFPSARSTDTHTAVLLLNPDPASCRRLFTTVANVQLYLFKVGGKTLRWMMDMGVRCADGSDWLVYVGHASRQ